MSHRIIILAIVFLLVGIYTVGAIYARPRARPFQRALDLVVNAEDEVIPKIKALPPDEYTKTKELMEKYVSIMTEANAIDLSGDSSYNILRGYIKESYELSKETVDYDAKIVSGKTIVTKEQAEQHAKEIGKKRKSITERYSTYRRIPSWMCFFLVYPPGACWML